MTDKSTEISRVTKPKNPGRVAQGHKLAELNKQRKQQLKEQSQEQHQEQSQEQPHYGSSLPIKSTVMLSLGILALLGYIVYDKIKTPKIADIPDQKIHVTPKPTKDPTYLFKMR